MPCENGNCEEYNSNGGRCLDGCARVASSEREARLDRLVSEFLSAKAAYQGQDVADATEIRREGNEFIIKLPMKCLELSKPYRVSIDHLVTMTKDLERLSYR